jgi:hypothetical protein
MRQTELSFHAALEKQAEQQRRAEEVTLVKEMVSVGEMMACRGFLFARVPVGSWATAVLDDGVGFVSCAQYPLTNLPHIPVLLL